ncbi:HMG (high mobility group) box [Microdochium nivale]|nr:HMG (high mobility group) box [Microdochium nivale]
MGDLSIGHPSLEPFMFTEPAFSLLDYNSSALGETIDFSSPFVFDDVCPEIASTPSEPTSVPEKNKSKSPRAKRAASKVKETPLEKIQKHPELLKKSLEMGRWSDFFSGKASEERFAKVRQHAHRSSYVRRQELLNAQKPGNPMPSPKRPCNRFILFRKTYQTLAAAHCKLERHQEISILCGAAWHMESKEVREKFESLEEADKIGHNEAFPRYKFNPTAKSKTTEDKKSNDTQARAVKKASKRLQNATNSSAGLCHVSPTSQIPLSAPSRATGQNFGLNCPKPPQNINLVYRSNHMQPLHGNYQGSPGLNNIYLKNGSLAQGTLGPIMGASAAQTLRFGGGLDFPYALPGCAPMTTNGAYMGATFPLIAQHDGAILSSSYNDFGFVDDAIWNEIFV